MHKTKQEVLPCCRVSLRYSPATGRLSKDIIAPYVHLLPLLEEPLPPPAGRASEAYLQRTTLLFFQGTVQKGKVGEGPTV